MQKFSQPGEGRPFRSFVLSPYVRRGAGADAAITSMRRGPLCALVVIGVSRRGEKRPLAIENWVRESGAGGAGENFCRA